MNYIRSEGAFPDNCLPPECDYASREALLASINEWAAARGYAFISRRSTREKSGKITVTYACDRNCRPPDASRNRIRKTATRGTSCPFSILAKQSPSGTTWSLRHRPDRQFATHNHPPSLHQTAHSQHRILSDADKASIKSLADAGIQARDIRTILQNNSTSMASQQDIYNYIAEVKRDRLKGQSSIHALAKQLEEDGFWKETQVDHDSRVTGLLFAHPRSLAYLEAYPDILILDCTYKTNKYKMPLLDMVGVDACGRSFCIAFAFLNGEAEEDYLWALGSLRAIYERAGIRHPSVILTDRCLASMYSISTCFPAAASLLCLWHANKAVLSRCRPAFTKYHQGPIADADGLSNWDAFYSHWHAIVNSKDEAAYHKAVQDIEKQYLHSHLNEVGYIRTTWLEPYKEKLVKAWVDKHCHFNNVVTSRAEGIHSLLKSYLKVSQLDLFDAWRSIKNALFNQLSELQIIQAKQQSRTLLELSQPLYHAVHGWVSYDALYKVDAQRKRLLKGDLPACTGAFTRSQGLPCAHMLLHIQEQGSQAL